MVRPLKYGSRTTQTNITIPEELKEKIKSYDINLSEFIVNNMRFLLDEEDNILEDYKFEFESLKQKKRILDSKIKDLKVKIEMLESFKNKDFKSIKKVLGKKQFSFFEETLLFLKEKKRSIEKSHLLATGKYPDNEQLYNMMLALLQFKVLKLKEKGVNITVKYLFNFLK